MIPGGDLTAIAACAPSIPLISRLTSLLDRVSSSYWSFALIVLSQKVTCEGI